MNNKKFMLAAALLALLLTVTIGGTLAYLVDLTNEVENVFTATRTTPDIDEEFDHKVKKNVTIMNDGNIAAYIRAMVVITWKDSQGNVYGKLPDNTGSSPDYFIDYGDDNWQLSTDGFWYYTKPVAAQVSTTNLIDECKPLKACENPNFTLHVEIIAQTVQAEPRNVVTSVWDSGVSKAADDGTLTIKE